MGCFVGAETGEQTRLATINRDGRSLCSAPVRCLWPGRPAAAGAGAGRESVTSQPGIVSLGSSTPDPSQHAECYLQTEPAGKGKTSYLAQSGMLPALGKKSLEL